MRIKKKFISFVLACFVIFFSFGFYQNILEISSLKKEKEYNENKLKGLKIKEEELNKNVEKLKDPEGQLDAAREEYNYLKEGEVKLDFNDDSKK